MKRDEVTNGRSGKNNAKLINRRKVLQAFGLAAITASAVPAFSLAIAKVQDTKKIYYVYGTIEELKQDTTIKEGAIVRTAGYSSIGDGRGAEFIIKNVKSEKAGTIKISNDLYASLINVKTGYS